MSDEKTEEQTDEKTDWIDVLKQARDELRVKMHLASMEARDEFKDLNDRLDAFDDQVRPKVGRAAMALDETATAIAKDLKKGFFKIRDSLKVPDEASTSE